MFKQGILITVKLCLIHVCTCDCPDKWPLPNVMQCLFSVTNGINGTNVLAGTDTATVRMFCDDGTFNRSVECLENLYNACGRRLIAQFAEPSEWRNAVITLCGTLQEHAIYSTCIVGQRHKVTSCLNHNDMMFQNSMTPPENVWEKLKIKICSFFEGIKVCTSEPVIRNCNVNVGRTMGNFISSLIPKLCRSDYVIDHSTYNVASICQVYHIKFIQYLFISLSIVWFLK